MGKRKDGFGKEGRREGGRERERKKVKIKNQEQQRQDG